MEAALGIGEVMNLETRDEFFHFVHAREQSGYDHKSAQAFGDATFQFKAGECARAQPVSDTAIDQGDGQIGSGKGGEDAKKNQAPDGHACLFFMEERQAR